MPTLADLTAAVPKCPRITKRMGHPDTRCSRSMRYDREGNVWRCRIPSCAMTIKGVMLAEYTAEADAGLREAA